MIEVESGYYNDDGTKLNPDRISKPGLCLTCRKDDSTSKEEMLCNLNRLDQHGKDTFECDAYEPIN